MSMGFPRQEYWSGLPFPFPGDLPGSGIELVSPLSPVLAGRFFTAEPSGEPTYFLKNKQIGKRDAIFLQFSSVQFSRSVMSDSLRPHELQHTRPPCPSPTPGVDSTHAHRVGDAIQSSHPLSSPPPPASNPSQHHCLFQWVNSSHEVAKVLEFQLQHQSF